jgi:hypothetical protein
VATLTWTGKADTSASNPQNWQPAQLPAAGDDLQMPLASTIDIHGDALAGDTLTIGSDGVSFPHLPRCSTYQAALTSRLPTISRRRVCPRPPSTWHNTPSGSAVS